MFRRSPHRPTQLLAVLICLALAGCAALGAGDTGLNDELRASRAEAEAEHARVAALEARLAQLEQRTQHQASERVSQSRVERLIEQNEVMLALAGATCDGEARASRPVPPVGSADTQEVATAEQRQQLAQRLRAYLAGRAGGLSLEQREAMRVLLRPDRVLDRSDPWH
jgi:hypothetical protein